MRLKNIVTFFLLLNITLLADDIIVIRHGEGTHMVTNVRDKGAHLTDKGKQQVAKTAAGLLAKGYNPENIAIVYVSPTTRTVETAEVLIASGLIDPKKIQIEPRIAEPDVKIHERKKTASDTSWEIQLTKEYGLESNADVRYRVKSFYRELMNKSWNGHVVLVTHSTPSKEFIDLHSDKRPNLKPAEAKIMPRN